MRFVFCFLFSALIINGLSAQVAGPESVFDQLYQKGELLEIELETDLEFWIENRNFPEEKEAILRYQDKEGQIREWEIDLSLRGRFRRTMCEFPPLKIDFDKSNLRDQGLAEYDKWKLVTHCVDEKGIGNSYLIREYLAYELYQVLTDNAYRAQLVEVTYKNKDSKPQLKRYGILLEGGREMGDRIGGEECEECLNLAAEQFDLQAENLLAVFQYMIGNGDWSTKMLRNVKVVTFENKKAVPVPYDFDFSGLVNASYAIPNADYQLASVEQRVFLGTLPKEEYLANTVELFKREKGDLFELVENFEYLPKRDRKDILKYLESFYDEIDALPVEEAKKNPLYHGK